MSTKHLLTRVAAACASARAVEVISQSACVPPSASINYVLSLTSCQNRSVVVLHDVNQLLPAASIDSL